MERHVHILPVHNQTGERCGQNNGRWWRMGSHSSVLDDFKWWSASEEMAEEAKHELDTFRARREEENIALQSLMGDMLEMTYEKEMIIKLRKEAENENQEIARLQYELEVEKKALEWRLLF